MILGPDGKSTKAIEGPYFFCDPASPAGEPDLTHINLLIKYGDKTYLCMMPLREIKFEERKVGNG